MSLKNVRVWFMGAGSHAAKVHYPSLAEMADVELAVVCDLDKSRRSEVAEKYRCKAACGDFRVVLDEEKPDAAPPTAPSPDSRLSPVMRRVAW